ncbi:hypothetical protein [Novosphingobium sp. B 225]|uniref:hypothetical protein n=1 Tax=Novosphingobium sp. B 225 TaxID=1961849 RepID=UPI0015958EEE|nr:hypothetical protein [Novosphingobium sp. B 225]
MFDQVVTGIGYSDHRNFFGLFDPVRGNALSYRSDLDTYYFVTPKLIGEFPTAPGETGPYNGSSPFSPSSVRTDLFGPTYTSTDAKDFRGFYNYCDQNSLGSDYNHDLYIYFQNVVGSRPYLRYSSFGRFRYNYRYDRLGSSYHDAFYFGIGSPTVNSRIPKSGMATYSGKLVGHMQGSSYLQRAGGESYSNMTLEVNFAAHTFTLHASVSGGLQGSTIASEFGPLTFSGSFQAGSANFSAISPDGKVAGFLSGPNAEELVVAMNGDFRATDPSNMPTAVAAAGGATR